MKLIFICVILSVVTALMLFQFNFLEVSGKQYCVIPFLLSALWLMFYWFIGIFLILFFNYDPLPKKVYKEEVWEKYEYKKDLKNTTYQKYDKKDDDFSKSFLVGALSDNPLMGGAVGGNYSASILGSTLNGL